MSVGKLTICLDNCYGNYDSKVEEHSMSKYEPYNTNYFSLLLSYFWKLLWKFFFFFPMSIRAFSKAFFFLFFSVLYWDSNDFDVNMLALWVFSPSFLCLGISFILIPKNRHLSNRCERFEPRVAVNWFVFICTQTVLNYANNISDMFNSQKCFIL